MYILKEILVRSEGWIFSICFKCITREATIFFLGYFTCEWIRFHPGGKLFSLVLHYSCRLNEGSSLKFLEGYPDWQAPDESQSAQQPKCDHNNMSVNNVNKDKSILHKPFTL